MFRKRVVLYAREGFEESLHYYVMSSLFEKGKKKEEYVTGYNNATCD